MMAKIKIKNFGPIKEGFEGWIEFGKVTVFTGNQGSGKSTIAKLFSTISWIEKAIVRGDLQVSSFNRKGQFERHCEYQNIQEYFKSDTEIEYRGIYVSFKYFNGRVEISEKENSEYHLPKIMYVPSERNLISSVRNISNLKGLPGTLYTFSDEYLKAVDELKLPVDLPINNVRFEYQKLNQIASIVGEDFKVRLMYASSGFQSLVPMFIVSKYITESMVIQGSYNPHSSNNELSLEQDRRLRHEIEKILSNPRMSDKVKQIQIELLSSRLNYSSFINIVEEPEQNLYPTSQQKMLYSLLTLNNSHPKNKLVITTHSPYLINFLTLAVKGGMLWPNVNDDTLKKEIETIIPFKAGLKLGDLKIYEMDEKEGTISLLPDYKGIPSDDNNLNEELDDFNSAYSHLIDIQNRAK